MEKLKSLIIWADATDILVAIISHVEELGERTEAVRTGEYCDSDRWE